jgi:hypothetical protein
MLPKNRMALSLGSMAWCVTAALAFSLLTAACNSSAPPASGTVVVDEEHHDSHHWDEHENSAWHRFLAEKHAQDHEYAAAQKQEQSEYWNWRHSHPD